MTGDVLGMDAGISEEKRSVKERLAQKAEDSDINVNVKELRYKRMAR